MKRNPDDESSAPPALRCIGCGYDLRGLSPESACPECGEPLASTMRGLWATSDGQVWGAKLRLGLLILLLTTPILATSALCFISYAGIGLPVSLVNFPGPKLWAANLVVRWGASELVHVTLPLALILVNLFGIWALTAPHPLLKRHEQPVCLRSALRFGAPMLVALLWIVTNPRGHFVTVPGLFVPLVAVGLEIPITGMLYL